MSCLNEDVNGVCLYCLWIDDCELNGEKGELQMRQLTKGQKSRLNKWFYEYKPTIVDELNPEHWQELEAINNTEILWQEVNRYLYDLWIDDKYERENLWHEYHTNNY